MGRRRGLSWPPPQSHDEEQQQQHAAGQRQLQPTTAAFAPRPCGRGWQPAAAALGLCLLMAAATTLRAFVVLPPSGRAPVSRVKGPAIQAASWMRVRTHARGVDEVECAPHTMLTD